MSSFTNALVIKDAGDGKYWTVQEPFRYYMGSEASNVCVDIPRGFKTDLASVPRLARLLVPKLGKYNAAAVVHDRLYKQGEYTVLSPGVSYPCDITRKKADDVFNEAMKICGVSPWRRRLIYCGVRVGGWKGWNSHRNAEL